MKKFVWFSTSLLFVGIAAYSQNDLEKYPNPEFSNEIYLIKKDQPTTLVRLEKGASKMNNKTKMGGMGGSESGYNLDGEKSTVRLQGGGNLSFVFYNGTSAAGSASNAKTDSIMQANGVDASMRQRMESFNDPSNKITLYKAESGKDQRKVLMMKSPGAMSFSKKMKSSDKFSFSVKKIREGYWELVIDKTLPKGEYAFTMMSTGMGSADGSTILYAFAVD